MIFPPKFSCYGGHFLFINFFFFILNHIIEYCNLNENLGGRLQKLKHWRELYKKDSSSNIYI
jgi:hypothetical protein